MNGKGSRGFKLTVASAALTVAMVALPAAAASAEGWENFYNVNCGTADVQTSSWSTGITEHFQRTVGGAEWIKSWDNQWIAQGRTHSFGLSNVSFAQTWSSHAFINGSVSCV